MKKISDYHAIKGVLEQVKERIGSSSLSIDKVRTDEGDIVYLRDSIKIPLGEYIIFGIKLSSVRNFLNEKFSTFSERFGLSNLGYVMGNRAIVGIKQDDKGNYAFVNISSNYEPELSPVIIESLEQRGISSLRSSRIPLEYY
jgi:hypothetical protein